MTGTTVSLLANHLRYVTAEDNGAGAVTANRTEARTWETYAMVQLGGDHVVFVTSAGYVLHVDEGTEMLVAHARGVPEGAVGDWFPPWAIFRLEHLPNGDVAMRSSLNTYVSADIGDEPAMTVSADTIGPWERFTLFDHAHGHPPVQGGLPDDGAEISGLDIPLRELHGMWLYPKDTFWAPAQFFGTSANRFGQVLTEYAAHGNIAVSVVNFVGGDEWSRRFFGVDHQDRVSARLQDANKRGLANIVFLMGNDYLQRELGYNFDRINDVARETAAAVAPWARIIIPLTEFHKSLPGRLSKERQAMYRAARQGTIDANREEVYIGAHGVSLEGIPVDDFRGIGNVASCVQGGFDTSLSDLRAFIEEDSARMRRYQEAGRFGRSAHLYVAFEHSIPEVSDRWRHSQTEAVAAVRGQACLEAGADLDFSGGVKR